jgi:hypothetical protein
VVRYLKFPLVSFLNPVKAKRYRIVLITFLIATIIPSTVIFYNVIQETRFTIASESFINDECVFDGSELISKKVTFSDTLSTIDLYYIGNDITDDNKLVLQDKLAKYGLNGDKRFPITKRTFVRVHQETDNNIDFERKMVDFNSDLKLKILEDIYTKNEQTIQDKELKIQLLEQEVMRLSKTDTIPYKQINQELKFHFSDVEKYSFAKATQIHSINDSVTIDTVPVFLVKFNEFSNPDNKPEKREEIAGWLKVRLNIGNLEVLEY